MAGPSRSGCKRRLSEELDEIVVEGERRTDWDFPYMVLEPFACPAPRDFKRKLETGVRNGDCLPACFAALLECLNRGCITSRNLEASAAELRAELIAWIKTNWLNYPTFQPEMPVHEIMWMQHDMGIPEPEREARGPWGGTAEERLAAYTAQCDDIYFSDAEMLMFASWMMDKRGLHLLFRTYRCTGRGGGTADLICHTPDPQVLRANGINSAVVIDLDHSGSVDSLTAHYKIIEGGSLQGLTKVDASATAGGRRLIRTAELGAEAPSDKSNGNACIP